MLLEPSFADPCQQTADFFNEALKLLGKVVSVWVCKSRTCNKARSRKPISFWILPNAVSVCRKCTFLEIRFYSTIQAFWLLLYSRSKERCKNSTSKERKHLLPYSTNWQKLCKLAHFVTQVLEYVL